MRYRSVFCFFKLLLLSDLSLGIAQLSWANPHGINWWLTTGNQSALLQKQAQPLVFGNTENQFPAIIVDSTKTYQRVDGFGFALTGSSALMINQATMLSVLVIYAFASALPTSAHLSIHMTICPRAKRTSH